MIESVEREKKSAARVINVRGMITGMLDKNHLEVVVYFRENRQSNFLVTIPKQSALYHTYKVGAYYELDLKLLGRIYRDGRHRPYTENELHVIDFKRSFSKNKK